MRQSPKLSRLIFALVFENFLEEVYLGGDTKPQIQTKIDNLVWCLCYGFGGMQPIQ